MSKNTWPLTVLVLAFGCSYVERDTGKPWPVEESTSAVDEEPDDPVEPNLADEPIDVIILRASRDDPHYGTDGDFYQDFIGQSRGLRCAALTIILDLQFQEPVILVLPTSITQTSEKYALEIPRWNPASWLLSSLSGGQVWAFKGRSDLDFESAATVKLLSFPFIADAVDPSANTIAHLLDCGIAPEGLVESIVSPPDSIEVEIWANGESTVLRMSADIQQRDSGLQYTYRGID
jgi:hypothetical protein